MNSYLLRNLSGITSASIEKYLLFTGWVRDDTFNSTRMWVFKSKSDPEFKIAVPASEKATDFYPQVYNLIQTLSVVDGKTEQEIISEASNPVPTPLLGHRCRSSQEITGSPTPFSTSNHYLWICASASLSLSNPNIAA